VAHCLYEQWVDQDETVRSDDGRLLLLKQGRAQVLSPDPGGRLGAVAELRPGAGVRAGRRDGRVDRQPPARGRPLQLLVLSAPALAALAMQLPAVAAALDAISAAAVPAGGVPVVPGGFAAAAVRGSGARLTLCRRQYTPTVAAATARARTRGQGVHTAR
jgi:hypothetical protein